MPDVTIDSPVPSTSSSLTLALYEETTLVSSAAITVLAPAYGRASFAALDVGRYRAVVLVGGTFASIVDHVTVLEDSEALTVEAWESITRVQSACPILITAANGWCTRRSLEIVFGKHNLATWLDLENTGGATPEDLDDIEARLYYHIGVALTMTKDALRNGPYVLPADDSEAVPQQLAQAVIGLAGVLIYEGRGVNDGNDDGKHTLSHHRAIWESFVNGVNNRIIKLDLDESQTSSAPQFVAT